MCRSGGVPPEAAGGRIQAAPRCGASREQKTCPSSGHVRPDPERSLGCREGRCGARGQASCRRAQVRSGDAARAAGAQPSAARRLGLGDGGFAWEPACVVPPTCPVTTAATPTRPSPGSPEGSAARRGSPAPAGRHHGRLRPPPAASAPEQDGLPAAAQRLAPSPSLASTALPCDRSPPGVRRVTAARHVLRTAAPKGLASCAARVGGEPWHMTDRGKATGKQCGQFSKCRTD